MDVSIARATDDDDLATVAKWHWDEWSHLADDPQFDQWVTELRSWSLPKGIPATWLARSNGVLIGSVTLDARDHGPQLVGLYVEPSYRARGVATQLIKTLEDEAREMGLTSVRAHTTDATALYRRLGYCVLEERPLKNEVMFVLSKQLSD